MNDPALYKRLVSRIETKLQKGRKVPGFLGSGKILERFKIAVSGSLATMISFSVQLCKVLLRGFGGPVVKWKETTFC